MATNPRNQPNHSPAALVSRTAVKVALPCALTLGLVILAGSSSQLPTPLAEAAGAAPAATDRAPAKRRLLPKLTVRGTEQPALAPALTARQRLVRRGPGMTTREISAAPVRFRNGRGQLRRFMPRLVRRADRRLAARGAGLDASLAAALGPEGEVARLRLAQRTVRVRLLRGPAATPALARRVTRDEIRYAAGPNLRLDYELGPRTLKEEIVLASRWAPTSYAFELSVPSARLQRLRDGGLRFSDRQTGRPLFELPKPFMYDAADRPVVERTVSQAVSYRVAERGSRFRITVAADPVWVRDAKRRLPIVVDPTITLGAPSYDVYVNSCSPTERIYSTYWLIAGNRGGCVFRTLLWFTNLPSLPRGAEITAAQLRLFQYETTQPLDATVNIHRVTTNWSPVDTYWNNQPGVTNDGYGRFVSGVGSDFVVADVRDVVRAWYGGAPNYGLRLNYANEGAGSRVFRAANYTADPNQAAKLLITYQAPYDTQCEQPGGLTLAQGDTREITVRCQNLGTEVWSADGPTPVRLGTWSPTDRGSGFSTEDGNWLGSNRIRMEQAKVPPGEWATFKLTLTGNVAPGTYQEAFNVVADGWSWMQSPVTIPVTVEARRYDFAFRGFSGYPALAPCESAPMWIELENTGNFTWQRSNTNLGTERPRDRASRFYTPQDWLSPNRPTAMDQDSTAPGKVGRFTFVATVPCDTPPGQYVEYFGPVQEGVTWLPDKGLYYVVTVGSEKLADVDNLGAVDYAANVGGVNVTNGNLVLQATDASLAARGGPLTLSRTYNSLDGSAGRLGPGWRFDFEQRLRVESGRVVWIADDGQQFVYTASGDGSYRRPANTYAKLTKESDGSYTITQKKLVRLRFSDTGQLVATTDRNNNTISLTYTDGRVSRISDPSGRDIVLGYDDQNKLSTLTDFAGRTTSYGYVEGRLTSVVDPRGVITRYEYTTQGKLAATVDGEMNRTRYSYDAVGRIATITDAKQLASADPASTRFSYDSATRTSITDVKGGVTRYDFDRRGAVTQITDPLGNTTSQTFDRDFNRLSTTNATGSQQQFAYDGAGNVARATDELGAVTSSTYDLGFGVPTSTTNPRGIEQRFEYDSRGNLLREYADYSNEPTKYTAYTYDDYGNRTSVTDPLGNTTTSDYDAVGRVTKQVEPPADQPKTTLFTYDAAGNQTAVIDPRGSATTTSYNAANQPISVTDPVGNKTSYGYDRNGNLTAETDANNKTTTYQYDQVSQLTKTTPPDASKAVTYGYDAAGNPTTVTDGKGQTSSTAYDAVGQPSSETTNKVTTTIGYNGNGDVTRVTEGSGSQNAATTTVAVDGAGQTKTETTTGLGTTRYGYDATGNTTKVSDPTGVIAASFDGKDQLTREGPPNTAGTQTSYDPAGNPTAVTTPAGKTTALSYDPTGEVSSTTTSTTQTTNANQSVATPVVDASSSTTTERAKLERDAVGNLTRLTLANGDVTDMAYDAANRLTTLATKNASGDLISGYAYAYDATDNISSIDGGGVQTTFTYDSLYELLNAADSQARTWAWTYDANGNRTREDGPSGTTSYGYGDDTDKNRLTSLTKNGTTTTFGYDGRGNNTARSDGTTLAYDTENAIVSAKIKEGPAVTYAYDADKRLLARTEAGKTTRYQYDGDRVVGETDEAGTVLVTYAYDDSGRVMSQTRRDPSAGQSKVYYYHYDNRGSVTSITDPAGTVVKRYSYDPWGNTLSEYDRDPANPLPNPYTYSGYRQDPTTKLYYLKARWYDPTIGRFLSVDPDPANDDPRADAALNANLYLYTNNNPVNRLDTDGTGFWGSIKKGASFLADTTKQFATGVYNVPVIGLKSLVVEPARQVFSSNSTWGQRFWGALMFTPVGKGGRGGRVGYNGARAVWKSRSAMSARKWTATRATRAANSRIGKQLFTRSIGRVNRNGFIRVGWGWKGSQKGGYEVFRVSLGTKVVNGRRRGRVHIDLFRRR